MVGLLFAAAAVVQVAEGAGEWEESETGVGYLSDEVVGVGQGFVLGLGVGPFLAELVYVTAEEDLVTGAVELTSEGADAVG